MNTGSQLRCVAGGSPRSSPVLLWSSTGTNKRCLSSGHLYAKLVLSSMPSIVLTFAPLCTPPKVASTARTGWQVLHASLLQEQKCTTSCRVEEHLIACKGRFSLKKH